MSLRARASTCLVIAGLALALASIGWVGRHRRALTQTPAAVGHGPIVPSSPGVDAVVAPPIALSPGAMPADAPGGTVTDTLGNALVGIEVEAELELGAGVQGRAPTDAQAAAARVRAVSDAVGRFAFAAITPGRYRLRLTGPQVFPLELRFVEMPRADLRVEMAVQVALSGQVFDQGRPHPQARVAVLGEGLAGRRELEVDADGRFTFTELPAGGFTVWAWHDDTAARAITVSRAPGDLDAPVALHLEPAAIVVGRVVERGGEVAVPAAVRLVPEAGDEPERTARADRDGAFRVLGVPHGRWIVSAFHPGYVETGTLTVEAGQAPLRLELVRGAVLRGRVVTPDGTPIAGASLRLELGAAGDAAKAAGREWSEAVARDQARRFAGRGLAVTAAGAAPRDAADGQFVPRGELGVLLGPIPYPPTVPTGQGAVLRAALIDDPEPTALEPGAVEPARWTTDVDGRFVITGAPAGLATLIAEHPQFAAAEVPGLSLAESAVIDDLKVVMGAGTYLVGHVRNQRGEPVVAATLQVAGRRARGLIAVTDATGAFRLGPLRGEIEVVVAAYAHATETRRVVVPEPPASGAVVDHPVEFVLEVADRELVATVEDPTGLPLRGARISVTLAGETRTVISDDGHVVVARLPAGAHVVTVEHPDYPPLRRTVRTDERVSLRVEWGGGLEVLVVDKHTGRGVPSLDLDARGPDGARQRVSSDADGFARLRPIVVGPWTVRAHASGYLPIEAARDVRAATQPGAITAPRLVLELERGAYVAGVIRDRFGSRVAGAEVRVVRVADGLTSARVRTDADGKFTVRDTPTGVVRVVASLGALAGELTLTLAAGDEYFSAEFDVR